MDLSSIAIDYASFDSVGIQAQTTVPEPASGAILAVGLVGFAVLRRRRRGPTAALVA
jgi:hypothetical protein